MAGGSLTWLTPIVAALITAGFGYLVALRRTSGRIATTEAAKLWEEARDLREVYQEEIERLNREATELRSEVRDLEERNRRLRAEVVELQRAHDALDRQNRRLQARVEELENGTPAA